MRKLYLLRRTDAIGYDEYDSCVVCAIDENDAKTIAPDGSVFVEHNRVRMPWAATYSEIECVEIGTANENQERGVITASFNAG